MRQINISTRSLPRAAPEIKVTLEIPGPLLDATYKGICSCGVQKDFGYMVLTAHRWADQHEAKGHTVTLTERETEPLDREKIQKILKRKGAKLV